MLLLLFFIIIIIIIVIIVIIIIIITIMKRMSISVTSKLLYRWTTSHISQTLDVNLPNIITQQYNGRFTIIASISNGRSLPALMMHV